MRKENEKNLEIVEEYKTSASNNSSLILEVGIPGGSEYFNKQVLYINLKTKEPEKMEILNNEGNPKFIVTYNEFEWKK